MTFRALPYGRLRLASVRTPWQSSLLRCAVGHGGLFCGTSPPRPAVVACPWFPQGRDCNIRWRSLSLAASSQLYFVGGFPKAVLRPRSSLSTDHVRCSCGCVEHARLSLLAKALTRHLRSGYTVLLRIALEQPTYRCGFLITKNAKKKQMTNSLEIFPQLHKNTTTLPS